MILFKRAGYAILVTCLSAL